MPHTRERITPPTPPNPEGDAGPVLLGKAERKALRSLARELDLGEFDLLLVGDGCGGDYPGISGWGCVAYDRLLKSAVVHAGAVTAGTVNTAELLPYLHALWYHSQEHPNGQVGFRVAVVSDSEVTVRCGNGVYARHANGAWWHALDWYAEHGYRFEWRHVRRLTDAWNRLADAVAAAARRQAEGLKGEVRAACDRHRAERER